MRTIWFILITALSTGLSSAAPTGEAVQRRMSEEAAAGGPVVIHVVVALCDNKHQGIVPVPASLGNGQDAAHNLYWGAAYGVATYLLKKESGWKKVADLENDHPEILDRIVLSDTISRGGLRVPVYLVAEAWDGSEMRAAVQRFFTLAAGRDPEVIETREASGTTITAGGRAHLVIFVGHNGLMDFTPPSTAENDSTAPARSAMVLACASDYYFGKRLTRAGAHSLLLTTGLMAPEAYTLNAAVRSWVVGKSADEVRESAADAYDRYQKCGIKAARRLFTTGP